VVDEELDQMVIEGMQEKSLAKLAQLPRHKMHSGNSEMRNWIAVAGAMHESSVGMRLIDYAPCYRSEAGTGCAMAFAHWQ
jgi:hypothetical protein